MSDFNAEISSDDKLWAALTYALPIIGSVLVLIMPDKKDRPFIKAHNIQALVLGILIWVSSWACIGVLVWFYGLYCAYQAYQGKYVEIPVLTDFVKKQGWA
jgi:uncharacterized protein